MLDYAKRRVHIQATTKWLIIEALWRHPWTWLHNIQQGDAGATCDVMYIDFYFVILGSNNTMKNLYPGVFRTASISCMCVVNNSGFSTTPATAFIVKASTALEERYSWVSVRKIIPIISLPTSLCVRRLYSAKNLLVQS